MNDKELLIDEVAVAMRSAGVDYYVHKKTGNVHMYSDEMLAMFQDIQGDPIADALKDIKRRPDDYLLVPADSETQMIEVMRDFAEGLDDEIAYQQLANALVMPDPIRQFKETVEEYDGLEDDWLEFQSKHYKRRAVRWLKDNGILKN